MGLTGGVCFPAARSRVVGGVAERAGGAFFFSLASGNTVLFTASGSRLWSGGVRASWHGKGKVRANVGDGREGWAKEERTAAVGALAAPPRLLQRR
jgi:hypothetical protein